MHLTFTQISKITNVVILILLFVGIYLLLQSMSLISAARQNFQKIMSDLYEMDGKRVTQAEMERRQYGTTSSDGKTEGALTRLLMHLDDKLVYSELSINYIWLNSSTYVVGTLFLAVIAFFVGLFVSIPTAVFLSLVAVLVPYVIIVEMAEKNYRATEDKLNMFINLVSSNSAMSGSILTVLDSCVPYAEEPIKGAIMRAVSTFNLNGRGDEAVWQLMREIEHPVFKNFIRNLDICSKNDADYRSVAKDYAEQAEQLVADMMEQRSIFADVRRSVGGLIGLSACAELAIIWFLGFSIKETVAFFQNSLLGLIILVFVGMVYGAAIIYLLIGRRR